VVKIRGKPGGILEGIANNCIKIFKKEDLSITVEHGIRSTDFLDVRLSLQKNEYQPYRKPNDPPVYIDAYSNHPPVIIKQISSMMNKRLSSLSSNQEIFDEEKALYVKAMKNSGHPCDLNNTLVQWPSISMCHLYPK
jgi:hypothetical protein